MTDTARDLIQRLADALHNAIRVIDGADGTQHIDTAHVVLSQAVAYLATPEPAVGPTDEELIALFEENDWNYISPETFLDIAHTLLGFARCAHQPPQPIPLSEQLPGPEDCDGEGRCWFWGDELCGDDDWGWKLLDRTHGINWSAGPWLPRDALPLPEAP